MKRCNETKQSKSVVNEDKFKQNKITGKEKKGFYIRDGHVHDRD